MNELFPLLSAVPVIGGIVALLYSANSLRESLQAQKRMVAALRTEIEEQVNDVKSEAEKPLVLSTESTADMPGENALPKFSVRIGAGERQPITVSVGDVDPTFVRHLYWQAVKGGAKNPDTSRILMAALDDLASSDRRVIKNVLKNNTEKGRVRYLHRLFTKATAQ